MKDLSCGEDIIKALFFSAKKIRFLLSGSFKEFDIGFEQAGILMMLGSCENANTKSLKRLNINELANIFEKDKATISRTIRVLENKQLIERTQEFGDKRVVRVKLTQKGYEKIKEIHKVSEGYQQKIQSHFSKQEQKVFVDILEKLLEVLQ